MMKQECSRLRDISEELNSFLLSSSNIIVHASAMSFVALPFKGVYLPAGVGSVAV